MQLTDIKVRQFFDEGPMKAVVSITFDGCLAVHDVKVIYAREGFVTVALSWVFLSLVGSLPFVISGEIPSFIDAFFETVSGFTTTGASIVPAVEELSKGILYWRSFSHWLGGMGVLVFLLALSPGDNNGAGFTMHLLRAESPGPDVGKLVPKMRQTATILYVICIGMTLEPQMHAGSLAPNSIS